MLMMLKQEAVRSQIEREIMLRDDADGKRRKKQ
jgi:hypothetical protein